MTRADRSLAVVLAGACLAVPLSTARAQSAEAEALFREGRRLIKHGELAAGCDKLAGSERLESSVGTLLNLGDCHERLGKLASAWAAFRKAEAMARRSSGDHRRQVEARRRAALLEPRLPSLQIEVRSRVDGLVVRRGGELVDAAQWNTALPVDPGSYAIVAEAPGHQPWRTAVSIFAGAGPQVVAIPRLEPMPLPPAPAPTVAWPLTSRVAPVDRPAVVVTHRAGTWSTTRKLSAGLALAGAGALGTAVYFGLHAIDLQDQSDRRCPLTVCADPDGLRLNDQAQVSATRANILYLASGGTLAAAVVLWFVGAPGKTRVVPTSGDHQLGIAMKGSF